MVIVAGHVTVDPEQRECYLAGSTSVVEKARQADGCLDFAITADLLDPGRVNLFERWESQAAVKTFRRRGPGNKQRGRGAARSEWRLIAATHNLLELHRHTLAQANA
jgi:heme-degrading monooxygenase HmoA